MERKPVPVRFLDLWLRIPPAVTAFLPAAWYWADEPLRAELQTSIAALVRRDPTLLSSLRASARVFRAPARDEFRPALELAGLLLSIWALADAPLRAEVEHMVQGYSDRHPGFGAAFVAMIGGAEDNDWMVFPFGRGPEARSALAALLGRLQS